MSTLGRWFWEIYLMLIILLIGSKAYFLLTPGSQDQLYYYVLRTMDPEFLFVYYARVIYIILNAIHCLPLFLYIHRIRFLSAGTWKFLFLSRCLFDIVGQNFEINTIYAYSHTNMKLLFLLVIGTVFPQIPSYVACYRYAFWREKMIER